ncbi:MAG TPA: hypothetical protein VLE89_02970 [Chlamydiales bacterium]|nr:hypothetical protein [Chlamydiales bacterium]
MRFILLALLFCSALFAEDKITRHVIQLEKGPLEYTATVGTLPAYDKERATKGEIGYVSFVREGKDRPITFCFNGGPGSAAILLNVGALGPRRIVSAEEGQSIAPPYQMADNLETILDLTDLVFIDPMGTGFSHLNAKEDGKLFYDVQGDIHSVGDFIRDYIASQKRWNCRKYLAGESYGTTRAAGVSEYLQTAHGMYLNGIVLISCAIDFQTFFIGPSNQDNQLPFFLYLPTYAATSWYHERYRPEATLQEVVEEATDFSYQTLAPALFRTSSLNKALYERLSQFTGLKSETIRRQQGRLGAHLFLREFASEEDKILGAYDTRLTAEHNGRNPDNFFIDPSVSQMDGIVTAAFQNYLQTELEYSSTAPYCGLSLEVNESWNFFSLTPWGYPNLMNSLRSAMLINPTMKVFVGSGYYDCVTPFAATDYCFDHLGLPHSIQSNIQMEYYEGGHMYYLSPSARIKFKQDLTKFYQ